MESRAEVDYFLCSSVEREKEHVYVCVYVVTDCLDEIVDSHSLIVQGSHLLQCDSVSDLVVPDVLKDHGASRRAKECK